MYFFYKKKKNKIIALITNNNNTWNFHCFTTNRHSTKIERDVKAVKCREREESRDVRYMCIHICMYIYHVCVCIKHVYMSLARWSGL